jgi:hypothetical protein
VAKPAVVDGHDVRVGLKGQVAVGVWSPALGDVACVAVDCVCQELGQVI